MVCQTAFISELCAILCQSQCVLTRYSQSTDGWRWVCRNDGFRRTIRKNSSKFSLRTILFIIYMWSKDFLQLTIAEESGATRNTVCNRANFLREICTHIEQNPIQLWGDRWKLGPQRGWDRQAIFILGNITEGDIGCLAPLNMDLASAVWCRCPTGRGRH